MLYVYYEYIDGHLLNDLKIFEYLDFIQDTNQITQTE